MIECDKSKTETGKSIKRIFNFRLFNANAPHFELIDFDFIGEDFG